MNKKVIILDLDNTIYPVSSIADELFKSSFTHIKNSGEFEGAFEDVVLEIQRTPFQKVAKAFSFSPKLLAECMVILTNLTYSKPMQFFDDYEQVRLLPQKKYLVTSGFTKMQHSKVDMLDIRNDFEEIHIIDLEMSDLTKKDIFKQIITENYYKNEELIVVGDDLNSEIQAGKDLKIDTVLYNKIGTYSEIKGENIITDFKELMKFL